MKEFFFELVNLDELVASCLSLGYSAVRTKEVSQKILVNIR